MMPVTNREEAMVIYEYYRGKKLSELTVEEHLAFMRIMSEHMPHLMHSPQPRDFARLVVKHAENDPTPAGAKRPGIPTEGEPLYRNWGRLLREVFQSRVVNW